MFGLIVRRAHAPLTVVVAVAALNLVWQAAPDEMSLIGAVRHVSAVLWIGAMTWLLLRVVAIGGEAVTELNPYDVADNLRARTRQNQARGLTRTRYVVILLISVALALMTIPGEIGRAHV